MPFSRELAAEPPYCCPLFPRRRQQQPETKILVVALPIADKKAA